MRRCIPFLILLVLACSNLSTKKTNSKNIIKIGGITFDGPSTPPITREMFESLKNTNTSWVATTPEAFTYHNTLDVKSFFKEGQWYGETLEGSITVIEIAKKEGYKVMMKPHIGFIYDLSGFNTSEKEDVDKENKILKELIEKGKKPSTKEEIAAVQEEFKKRQKGVDAYISTQKKLTNGSWRGDFEVKDSLNWELWERGYENFIMECARIADSTKVDLFCIGTELSISAVKRDFFWRSLIKKVKQVYSGPITFSANWDNYQNIKFWDELDYIGISAYFPLSDKETPSLENALNGWEIHTTKMEQLSKNYNKPILFTEFGYLSMKYSAKEPWLEKYSNASDENVQANLYEALFTTFWDEDWFVGGFVWKWYYSGNGGEKSYSPQGKAAEKVMSKWYDSKS